MKSSEENSVKEYDDIFSKNIIQMKYFSGNNGLKGNPLKFKKKINLGNKSLSEFKIKKKQKINLNIFNQESNKANVNYNLYKIYNQAYNNKNKNNTTIYNTNNNKSNSIQRNTVEMNLTHYNSNNNNRNINDNSK